MIQIVDYHLQTTGLGWKKDAFPKPGFENPPQFHSILQIFHASAKDLKLLKVYFSLPKNEI